MGGGLKVFSLHKAVLVWLVVLLPIVSAGLAIGADTIPIRLVTLINQDDQGENIEFPYWVYYDYWASETYLISSNRRITIYDQKFFPVASFGQGRGLGTPSGLTVDRHGNIYVCQDFAGPGPNRARLTIYNQAFFVTKDIVFAKIPELAEFAPGKVAVSESGEIYLTGHWPAEDLAGVVVLTPEGNFARFLLPPEKNAFRPRKKNAPAVDKEKEGGKDSQTEKGSADDSSVAALLPAGLKPKTSSRARDVDEDRGEMDAPYISDVKIDRQGRIYLLSREVSNIFVLNAREEYLFKFGEKGGAAGKLSTPIAMGIDLERRVIYVCDYMRHTILCYDYDDGRFIFEFGGQGLGPMWFNFPNSIDVDQRGRVIVSDLFNRRLQVIDPNIGERRPLSGSLGGLVQGKRPTAEEPEPLAPAVDTTALLLPSAPPPEQSLPLSPIGGSLPLKVLPPTLPSLIAGISTLPGVVPLSAVNSPPLRLREPSVRELAPLHLKKAKSPGGPFLQMVKIAPARQPEMIPRPAPVRIVSGRGGAAATRLASESVGILARFRAMPAAVGVYGPVAAIIGVGSWLLYTNR